MLMAKNGSWLYPGCFRVWDCDYSIYLACWICIEFSDYSSFSTLFGSVWSGMWDSNVKVCCPKPMSEPSCRPVAPSLTLSGTPAVPLWNSFALFVSGTAFVFWDLCGMKFCILKVLPTRFSPGREWSWLQKSAHKLRRINNEISAGVTLPTLSINGKCVVVAKTPSENVQTKKKLAHFLWFLHRAP